MRRGSVSLLHLHKTFTELYYIIEGKGEMRVGKKTFSVRKDTLVEIPRGSWHMLKNIGKTRLYHLVICVPEFNPRDVVLALKNGR